MKSESITDNNVKKHNKPVEKEEKSAEIVKKEPKPAKIIKKVEEKPKPITYKKYKKIKDLTDEEAKAVCERQKGCRPGDCELKYKVFSCVVKNLEAMKNDIDIHLNKEVGLDEC